MLEAFKIGIGLYAVDHATHVLQKLQKAFGAAGVSAAQFKQQMATIAGFGIAGAALLKVGEAGMKAGDAVYEAGKHYDMALARFRQVNAGADKGPMVQADFLRQADEFARGSKIIGTSAAQLMDTLTDAHTVVADFPIAKSLTPMIAQMEFANKALYGENSKFGKEEANNMLKTIEMRGGFRSEREMRTQFDFTQRAMSGTQNMVGPNEYRQLVNRGGAAILGMDNDTFYFESEPMIQAMGAAQYGTGLASAYQNMALGRTTVRAARAMQKYGMLHGDVNMTQMSESEKTKMFADKSIDSEVREDLVELNKKGQLAHINPGAITNAIDVGLHPLKFLRTVLLPGFASKGIVDKDGINRAMNEVFTNRKAAQAYFELYLASVPTENGGVSRIDKAMTIDRNAAGTDQTLSNALGTPQGGEDRLKAAYDKAMENFGHSLIPFAVPILNGLASGLESLASAIYHHPDIARRLMEVGIGLTLLATGIGILMVGNAARMAFLLFMPQFARLPFSLAASGIRLLFSPITLLARAAWVGIAGGLGMVARGLMGLAGLGWQALVAGANAYATAVGRLAIFAWSTLASGLSSLVAPLLRLVAVGWGAIAGGLTSLLGPLGRLVAVSWGAIASGLTSVALALLRFTGLSLVGTWIGTIATGLIGIARVGAIATLGTALVSIAGGLTLFVGAIAAVYEALHISQAGEKQEVLDKMRAEREAQGFGGEKKGYTDFSAHKFTAEDWRAGRTRREVEGYGPQELQEAIEDGAVGKGDPRMPISSANGIPIPYGEQTHAGMTPEEHAAAISKGIVDGLAGTNVILNGEVVGSLQMKFQEKQNAQARRPPATQSRPSARMTPVYPSSGY